MGEFRRKIVIATLKEMGQRPTPSLSCTFALSESCLVAQKFFYEGGYAVWVADRGAVDFYDEDGGLLKSVGVGMDASGIAA